MVTFITAGLSHWLKGYGKEVWNFNDWSNSQFVPPVGENQDLTETVIEIRRISKKTKGGNQIRFSALVVVGDKKGKVGVGLAKAGDVRGAIKKSLDAAKKKMIEFL